MRARRAAKRFVPTISSRLGSGRFFTPGASSAGHGTIRTTRPPSFPTDQLASVSPEESSLASSLLVAVVVPVRVPVVVVLLSVPGMRPDDLQVGGMHPGVGVRKG